MKKIFQMKEQSQKEAGVKDGKELHIRKNDWILIVILLVAAAGIYVAIQYYQKVSTQNAVAVVTVWNMGDIHSRKIIQKPSALRMGPITGLRFRMAM